MASKNLSWVVPNISNYSELILDHDGKFKIIEVPIKTPKHKFKINFKSK